MSLLKVVNDYRTYFASGTSHTARAKRLDLDSFLRFLQIHRGVSNQNKLTVADWDFSSVQRFVDELLNKGEAPTTVARRLATIKHMGRTFAEKIPGFINPAREVKPPRVPISKPKSLTKEEVDSARALAEQRLSEKSSFIRYRNQVLFDLFLDTGIRADEARVLTRGQIDEEFTWIRSVRTKGRKYRNVCITSVMRPRLLKYLEEREKVLRKLYPKLTRSHDHDLPLFISKYNAVPGDAKSFMMGAKSIWRAINELSAGTHLHPHLLRHSYALDLLESSNDVRLVAQALGHSDVRITMRYTERREQEVAAALEISRRKMKLLG